MPFRKNNKRELLFQAVGAIPWGIFFAVAVTEIFIIGFIIWAPLLAWREEKRTKKYGFLPGSLVRLGVIIAIILVAAMIPNKFEDQIIALPEGQKMSLEEIRSVARSQDLRVPFETYDQQSKSVRILITRSPITIGDLLNEIEMQTGKECRVSVCGNGLSFLNGGYVMGVEIRDPLH